VLIDLHLHTSTKWISPPIISYGGHFSALPSSSKQYKAPHHCDTMSPAADHFLRWNVDRT